MMNKLPADKLNAAPAAMSDFAPVALTFGICVPFLISGLVKAVDISAAAAEFAGLGLPAPLLLAWLTVAVQLAGSVTAIWGGRVPATIGALTLAAFTVAATLVAHAFWAVDAALRTAELNIFTEHVSIVCALLFVAWTRWNSRSSDD